MRFMLRRTNNVQSTAWCLFWTERDLQKLGNKLGLTEADVRSRYFYSGGCVRDFCSGENEKVWFVFDLGQVPVRRLRMKTLVDVTNLACYTALDDWIEVITSKYVMTLTCAVAQPDYSEMVLHDCRRLPFTDASLWRLLDLGHLGYFHTMAFQQKKKLFLHVRDYDKDSGENSASASSDEVVQVVVHGPATGFFERSYETCLETLRAWAETPTEREYWIPRVSEFEPVDAIVKFVREDG